MLVGWTGLRGNPGHGTLREESASTSCLWLGQRCSVPWGDSCRQCKARYGCLISVVFLVEIFGVLRWLVCLSSW